MGTLDVLGYGQEANIGALLSGSAGNKIEDDLLVNSDYLWDIRQLWGSQGLDSRRWQHHPHHGVRLSEVQSSALGKATGVVLARSRIDRVLPDPLYSSIGGAGNQPLIVT